MEKDIPSSERRNTGKTTLLRKVSFVNKGLPRQTKTEEFITRQPFKKVLKEDCLHKVFTSMKTCESIKPTRKSTKYTQNLRKNFHYKTNSLVISNNFVCKQTKLPNYKIQIS